MKTNILSFLLGIFLIVLTSSALVDSGIVTFKPATPKYTVSYNGRHPEIFTQEYAKKGYVVTSSASCGYYYTYVVMVKY